MEHGPWAMFHFLGALQTGQKRRRRQGTLGTMIDHDLWRRLARETQNLFPLFRYLILQTETHGFCLALAGAALLGFFPSCLVMLAIFKNILRWEGAYDVLLSTLQAYFPVDQDFVIRNLKAHIISLRHGTQVGSLV